MRAGALGVVLAAVVVALLWLGSTGDASEEDASLARRSDDVADVTLPLTLDEPRPTRLKSAPAPEETFAVDVEVTVNGEPPTPRDELLVEYGVRAADNDVDDTLGPVALDASGRATLDVPWRLAATRDADGRRPSVWVRASGRGVLTKASSRRVPKSPGDRVALALFATRGVEIVGRVVDVDRNPVAARVEATVVDDGGRASSGTTETVDGQFTLPVRRAGMTRITALATTGGANALSTLTREDYDLGTGASEPFLVDFRVAPAPVEITVRGPGTLRGRVRDPRGISTGSMRLTVETAALAEAGTSVRSDLRTRLRDEARGHSSASTTTDADGSFAIRGLRDDDFHIETWTAGGTVRLTDRAVRSDGRWLELEVTRPSLTIHVVDVDGRPVDLDAYHFFAINPPSAWLDFPTLVVLRAETPAELDDSPYASRIGPGTFIVDVADATLDVGVLGAARWSPRRVHVPADAGADVTLVVDESNELGTIELSVLDHTGRECRGAVRLRLCDPDRGTVLIDRRGSGGDEESAPQILEAAPGEYRLLVDAAAEVVGGTAFDARTSGGFEEIVRVDPGITTRVVAHLSQPARLRATLVGEPDTDDLATQPERYAERARLVRMRLERDDRWPEEPLFPYEWSGGTALIAAAPLGETTLSEPLTPGAYRLVATTPGGRTQTRDVLFEPGATLDVTLVFD